MRTPKNKERAKQGEKEQEEQEEPKLEKRVAVEGMRRRRREAR